MDTALVLKAAEELCGFLEGNLKDIHTQTIPLNRDQALLTLGLLEGLTVLLRKEAGGFPEVS